MDPDDCDCDHVQVLIDDGDRFELHHMVPDDGVAHVYDVDCPCAPDIERLDTDLIVVEHIDQDTAAMPAP